MATVLERCNELGIQHTKEIRSFVGERVSETFRKENPCVEVLRVEQKEGDFTFPVNYYPNMWKERMDYVIILACAELYKKTNGES